jgi:hypothetical protein
MITHWSRDLFSYFGNAVTEERFYEYHFIRSVTQELKHALDMLLWLYNKIHMGMSLFHYVQMEYVALFVTFHTNPHATVYWSNYSFSAIPCIRSLNVKIRYYLTLYGVLQSDPFWMFVRLHMEIVRGIYKPVAVGKELTLSWIINWCRSVVFCWHFKWCRPVLMFIIRYRCFIA